MALNIKCNKLIINFMMLLKLLWNINGKDEQLNDLWPKSYDCTKYILNIESKFVCVYLYAIM